jgi:hypothetical protein
MSEVDNSLFQEIETVIHKFDSDGKLASNCVEILHHIEEHISDIATTYWNYWVIDNKIPELDDTAFRSRMINWTTGYIRERLLDAKGSGWRKGLLAQVIDARKRNIPLSDVLAATANTSIQYHFFLGQKVDRSSSDFLRLSKTIIDFSNADLAIIATCYTHYQTSQMLEKQINFTQLFESDITAMAVDNFRPSQYPAATSRRQQLGRPGHAEQSVRGCHSVGTIRCGDARSGANRSGPDPCD